MAEKEKVKIITQNNYSIVNYKLSNFNKNKFKLWRELSIQIHINFINENDLEIGDYLQYQQKNIKIVKYFIIYKNNWFCINKNNLKYYIDLKDKYLNYYVNKNGYIINISNLYNNFKIITINHKLFYNWIKIFKKYLIQRDFSLKFGLKKILNYNEFSETSIYINFFDNKNYVVKKFKKEKLTENYFKIYLNELNILLKIKHKNLIKLKERYEDENYYYLVFKKFGISLNDYKIINQEEILIIFKQIIDGLKNLNSLNIIHRDLKPDNILVKKNKNKLYVKIIDFGLSSIFNEDKVIKIKGTPGYIAPENIIENNRFCYLNFNSDIFSLGCILYYLLKGEHLFFSDSLNTTLEINKQSIINIKSDLKFSNINRNFKIILNLCLEKNPEKRINLTYLEKLFN